MPNAIVVLGINPFDPDCLEQRAREYLQQAHQLWGSEKQLSHWQNLPAQKIPFTSPLLPSLQPLTYRGENENIVLLTSGDPGFFGLGSSLLKLLPSQEIILIPQPSTLQLAFARAHISWDEAAFTSAHARSLAEVIGIAKRYPKVGILTDPQHKPALIADYLLQASIPDCRAIVFENLGASDERMTDTRLELLIMQSFALLNVLLIVQEEGWKPFPSILIRPDNVYAHREGMITKADVRLLALHRLQLRETDVVWDVGAGSGAMSLEMGELAWRGQVYAIEKDGQNQCYIQQNINTFCALNVHLISGVAPQVLAELPEPDAVFIGGSDGNLLQILDYVRKKAIGGCRLVAHFAVLENLMQAFAWMEQQRYCPIITQVQLSYSTRLGAGSRFVPLNPIFVLSGELAKIKI